MKLLIVILLVACVDMILGALINNRSYMNKPTMFCGSKLSIELSILCRGWYNLDPRSQPLKTKRGIVDECCSVPCTRQYLKDYYCGPLPDTTTPKITVNTEPAITASPVDYYAYYYALIGRVLAEYPKDYPIH